MLKVILVGAALLGFHGHHQQRYLWVPLDGCTVSTSTTRQGAWHGTPYIQCGANAGGWHSTPESIPAASTVNPTVGAENYCPYRPNGNC